VKNKWNQNFLSKCLRILPPNDRKKIILVVTIQVMSGFLDLVGVAIIGILGALAITGIESGQPGNRVSFVLRILHLSHQRFQSQAAILGVAAALILTFRTIFSITFTRRTLFFLSRRGATLSSILVRKVLSQSLVELQTRSSQETIYAVTYGVQVITLGVLGAGVMLVSDASLLVVLAGGLFILDPLIALSTSLVFTVVGYSLYRYMNVKAKKLGVLNSSLSVQSNIKLLEALTSFREIVVRDRRDFYARNIGALRLGIADSAAELQFMPSVSKYVVETSMVLGSLLVAGIQFAVVDAKHAVATLAVFLAAGTRIAPAALRIQQGAIQIKSSIGSANSTLNLIKDLEAVTVISESTDLLCIDHRDFNPTIEIKNVDLRYPNSEINALTQINLSIPTGISTALVGPSGAGKTSLVDILLGVIEPSTGSVAISGVSPAAAIKKWPGAIAYVPQDVLIIDGTIRENLALGYLPESVTDAQLWQVLKMAQLFDYVKRLERGLDTEVGERGTKMSGGQRQRLGIARALITQPKLLVLDEATSALDGITELGISEAIRELEGSVTVVLIAHRLSTVSGAKKVVYLNTGQIIIEGTFQEVRENVPEFDRQANLMGINQKN